MKLKNIIYVSIGALMMGAVVSLTSFGAFSNPCLEEKGRVERLTAFLPKMEAQLHRVESDHRFGNHDYEAHVAYAKVQLVRTQTFLKKAHEELKGFLELHGNSHK